MAFTLCRVCVPVGFLLLLFAFPRNIKNVRLASLAIRLSFTARLPDATTANEIKYHCSLFSRENEQPFITRYANCPVLYCQDCYKTNRVT